MFSGDAPLLVIVSQGDGTSTFPIRVNGYVYSRVLGDTRANGAHIDSKLEAANRVNGFELPGRIRVQSEGTIINMSLRRREERNKPSVITCNERHRLADLTEFEDTVGMVAARI